MWRTYHVYILTNDSGTLYVGVTSNLERRVGEHRLGLVDGFTKKYRLKRLVYYEETNSLIEYYRERDILAEVDGGKPVLDPACRSALVWSLVASQSISAIWTALRAAPLRICWAIRSKATRACLRFSMPMCKSDRQR